MEKRGQVTTFIIIGIVIIAVVLFIFFLKDTLLTTISGEKAIDDYLKTEMKGVEDEIKKCVDSNSRHALGLIAKQGGFIESLNYVLYKEDKVGVLCSNIGRDRCLNSGLFNTDIEKRLNLYMKEKLKECVNLKAFKEGFKRYDYEMSYDMNVLDVDTRVNDDNILFKVFLPVEIKKDKFELSNDEFVKRINVPLGRILIAVNDILNSEAIGGDFDIAGYSMMHINEYDISMSWRGNDRIYVVNAVGSDYLFQFAVEGKDEV